MFNSKATNSFDSGAAGSGKRASRQKQFAVLMTSDSIIELSLKLFGYDYDHERPTESELDSICQAYHQFFDKRGFRYDRWSVSADNSVIETSGGERRTPAATEKCEHTPSTPSMATRRKSTRSQTTPGQAAVERKTTESIGRRETRRYQYLSEDESSGVEETFRKSPRAKRSLGHQSTKENPAKKAKVNNNNSEAGRKTSSPSTSIISTVLGHSPIKAAESAAQKTPQPVGKNGKKRKLPPESVKKSGKVLTRQRAAAKRAISAMQGTAAAEQAKPGPSTSAYPASHTPGKAQLVSQSISKKYKKYQIQNKKLLQVKLKISTKQDRERETQNITPPLMLDETLTASPNTSLYLDCPDLRVRIPYRNDLEREICEHAFQRQACVLLHKLSVKEYTKYSPEKNEKPSKTKAQKQKAVSQAKLAATKGRKETTTTSPKSSKENEQSRKTDQSKASHASNNVLKANNTNKAAADFITPRPKRMMTAAAAAAAMDDTYCDYPVTPFQPGRLLDEDNYDVSELHDSRDEDSDEDSEREPKKPIPSWARDPRLMERMMDQVTTYVPLATIFGSAKKPILLDEVFAKSKKNFLTRSSSANWDTTPHK